MDPIPMSHGCSGPYDLVPGGPLVGSRGDGFFSYWLRGTPGATLMGHFSFLVGSEEVKVATLGGLKSMFY